MDIVLGGGFLAGAGDGGGDDPNHSKPSNYKPSTNEQRENWNLFLDYLEKKGVGGSKDLDARDKSLGLQYLKEFNEKNPKNKVDQEFIPVAQYESYLIRKKGEFPGLSDQQAKDAFGGLPVPYKVKPISNVDNWLGSAISRQFYPTFERGTPNGTVHFGTSFETYLQAHNAQ